MNNDAMNPAKKHFLLPLLIITLERNTQKDTIADLFIFLVQYSFLCNEPAPKDKILKRDVSYSGELSTQKSNGARYLDPKYSRWISTDSALGEYIPAAGKGNSENAGNLPGMGGIYNHINGDLYHYAGNNPVRYLDPTGAFDIWNDSKNGFSLWFNAVTHSGDVDVARNVSDFMNDNPEFWLVLGTAGLMAGVGYGIYSLCPPVKSFIDGCCEWVMELNENMKSLGINISDLSYSYNNFDVTKFQITFNGSSISNFKTNILLEQVLYKINDERGNILSGNLNFDISKNYEEIFFTISFSFNGKYREKNYEEIISSFTF